MATRWRMPREKVRTREARRSNKPTSCKSFCTRAAALGVSWSRAKSRRFSSAVSSSYTMVAWATKPAAILACVLGAVLGTPLGAPSGMTAAPGVCDGKVSSPEEGRTRPAAILSRVVFPEPLRPASATHSPGTTSKRMRRSADKCAESLFNIFEANAGGRKTARCHQSASNEIAQDFFGAGPLRGVLGVGDGAGLVAELQPEQLLFQIVEAGGHGGVDVFQRRGGGSGWR